MPAAQYSVGRFKQLVAIFAIIFGTLCQSSCKIYSFTGASIAPEVKTASVNTFDNVASTLNPLLVQMLTEKLKDKINAETRLTLLARGGDVDFDGVVLSYLVEPAAAGADSRALLNRLSISIRVDFYNKITGETWSQVFKDFENFDRNANLVAVESQLIEQISSRLVDVIFAKAFSNW